MEEQWAVVVHDGHNHWHEGTAPRREAEQMALDLTAKGWTVEAVPLSQLFSDPRTEMDDEAEGLEAMR